MFKKLCGVVVDYVCGSGVEHRLHVDKSSVKHGCGHNVDATTRFQPGGPPGATIEGPGGPLAYITRPQAREGRPYSNRLDPDTLNHLDRRILRESFRQAQRLQSSLAVRYQL